MRKYQLFIILCITAGYVYGQRVWSLDSCIQYAIRENLELKKASINNIIKEKDYRLSYVDMLPSLNSYISLANSFGRSVDPTTNNIISTQVFQAGLNVGTSVTLFQGFVNLNKIMFNKINMAKGLLEEEMLKNEIAVKVMEGYYNHCFNRGLLQIAVDQRDLSAMNLKKVQVMEETGIRSKTDLADMEARLALDEYKLTQMRNTSLLSMLTLRQLLNLPKEQSFDINTQGTTDVIFSKSAIDADSVYKLARQNMPQFKEMEAESKLAALNIKLARGGRIPSITANAGYGTGYFDSYLDSNGRILPFSYQAQNNASQYLGLSVNVPIFNGSHVNRAVNTARLNANKTRIDNEIISRRLYAEIENACFSVQAAADEYISAQGQEKAVALTLELTEKKWEHGTATLLELTDARNRSSSARAEMLRTKLQYEMKLKTIWMFTGNVKWE